MWLSLKKVYFSWRKFMLSIEKCSLEDIWNYWIKDFGLFETTCTRVKKRMLVILLQFSQYFFVFVTLGLLIHSSLLI